MKGKMRGFLAVLLSAMLFCGCAGATCDCNCGDDTGGGKTPASDTTGKDDQTDDKENPGGTGDSEVKTYWQDEKSYGITVAEDGSMMLGTEKLYLSGVDCYNLFNQCVSDNFSAEKAKETLDILAENNIGVVRFNCGGYDYKFLDNYFNQKEAYLNLLKEIASYAQQLEIGLIPSLFWLHNAVPDYYDEPIRYWGKANSQTIAFLKEYTTSIVSALKEYKAIFAWEFGNEFNLACDLPNAAEHMPSLPSGSSRSSRTAEDYLSASDMGYALLQFSAAVLNVDKSGRMITTGNATLRPSQYHQLNYGSWEQDTEEQFSTMLATFAPTGVNAISEHVYFTSQTTFGRELSLAEYLEYMINTAKTMKKAYYIGEWGGGNNSEVEYYRGIGNAFVDAGVQLVLLWNFNLTEGSVESSFSGQSERGKALLKIVGEMNTRYKEEFRKV